MNYWYELTDQLFEEEDEDEIEGIYPSDTYFELIIRQDRKKRDIILPFPNYRLCRKRFVYLGVICLRR
jgi:hypothetical protein